MRKSRAADTGGLLVSHSLTLEINEDPERIHSCVEKSSMFMAVVEQVKNEICPMLLEFVISQRHF